MSKVKSILLNVDFYSKGRNVRWIKQHGAESVLILQAVWIAISQEGELKIKKEDALNIPFLMMFEEAKVREVLDSAVEVGLLEADQEFYLNSQVTEHSERYEKKTDNYSKAAKAREEAKREQNKSKTGAELEQNLSKIGAKLEQDENQNEGRTPLITFNLVKLDLIDLDISIKEMDTPEIRLELSKFAAKVERDSKGKRRIHQQTLDNWLNQYRDRPQDFLEALRFSNGLVSCWNLKEPDKPKGRGTVQKKSSYDVAMELLAKEETRGASYGAK